MGCSARAVVGQVHVFMNTVFLDKGRYFTEAAISEAGDRIVMRADMDLIGTISACSQDLYPANGYEITDLEVIVGDTDSWTLQPLRYLHDRCNCYRLKRQLPGGNPPTERTRLSTAH